MKNDNLYKSEIASGFMKKGILLSVLFLFLITFISSVSAFDYWQTRYIQLNDSRVNVNYAFVSYTTEETKSSLLGIIYEASMSSLTPLPSGFGYLWVDKTDGRDLEVRIDYNSYVDVWNKQNPQFKVKQCVLTVKYQPYYSLLQGQSEVLPVVIFKENLTSTIDNGQYFVRLKKGDTMYSKMECSFYNNATIETPADFRITTPTENCQECQYYKWNSYQAKLNSIDTVSTYKTNLLGFTVRLLKMNYEIIIVLYWIFLISALLMAVGLIIYGILFVFMKLKRIK